MLTLPELLKTLVEQDGSDLHITTNTPPQIRVHGHLRRLPGSDMQPSETKQLVYSVLTDAQKKRFEESMELDFSFGILHPPKHLDNLEALGGVSAHPILAIPVSDHLCCIAELVLRGRVSSGSEQELDNLWCSGLSGNHERRLALVVQSREVCALTQQCLNATSIPMTDSVSQCRICLVFGACHRWTRRVG
jgi:hypothetical protein